MEDEGRAVEGEVVPPGGPPPKAKAAGPGTFFHPLSGAVILGVDWLAFGLEWASGFVLTAAASLGAFAIVFWAVYRIQLKLSGDSPKAAAAKAVIGAVAAGVPFPVTGTAVGGLILALSGLKRLPSRR